MQRVEPALREAVLVDAAGVLALGVGAEERALEEDLAAGAAPVALAAPLRDAARRCPAAASVACTKRLVLPRSCSVINDQSAMSRKLLVCRTRSDEHETWILTARGRRGKVSSLASWPR